MLFTSTGLACICIPRLRDTEISILINCISDTINMYLPGPLPHQLYVLPQNQFLMLRLFIYEKINVQKQKTEIKLHT